MIRLSDDYLFFQLPDGRSIPLRAEALNIQVETSHKHPPVDDQTVGEAAAAVFHYFKHEMDVDSVSLGDFSAALEKVLHGLSLSMAGDPAAWAVRARDLRQMAQAAAGCELLFFPLLRQCVKECLQNKPDRLHFLGLRQCVKLLSGTRRWNRSCGELRDRILRFLQDSVHLEVPGTPCALVVE